VSALQPVPGQLLAEAARRQRSSGAAVRQPLPEPHATWMSHVGCGAWLGRAPIDPAKQCPWPHGRDLTGQQGRAVGNGPAVPTATR
jgi:hypothetical protein